MFALSGLGQGEDGIIFGMNMSGEIHMRDGVRYSAAYPAGAEQFYEKI